MLKDYLPKGKAQLAFVGVIASVVIATFAVGAKGIYDAATDSIGADNKTAVAARSGEGLSSDGKSAIIPRVDASLGAPSVGGQGAGQNQSAISPSGQFAVKRVLKIDGPMKHGSFVWDEQGVPKDGQVIVTVDLAAQTMSVFRGGYEIGAAVILYGADNKETPLGIFPISQKKVDHVSNLYDAPMPYMQRLTDDGVAIHASDVAWGNATHGCIGIPLEFAKKLYGATKLGDIVIITDGQMMNTGQG